MIGLTILPEERVFQLYSVVKGASYFLAHAPNMVVHNGTTQTTQRKVDPNAEYLTQLEKSLRSYEDCVAYLPNQVYIGNMTPEELEGYALPWYEQKASGAQRKGKYGEIMPEDEFIGMMKICDVFDLVKLEAGFSASVKDKLGQHALIDASQLQVFDKHSEEAELRELVDKHHAEPIFYMGKMVGCIKAAHDIDDSLSAHVMFENIVSKASCVLSILHLMDKTDVPKDEIAYVVECSEEACGDMNQRGGGNFAKAAAEIAGLTNATGCDVRGFCAGPTHALLQASSLVKAGLFKYVIVAAGGSTAKLGMNGKDHVKKGLPVLEDCVAGFAVLVGENDGISPEINTDILGKHTVGTGSSPQAVISSLTATALEKAGLKLTDVDKYSVEMQNPDITKPAGAGNVPEANYKMIGALAAMRGDIQKAELTSFVKNHGMVGWAPTQGHIPSGVPYMGFARQDILDGKISRAMFIGKGSLFLGRMTNLFDGVSFVLQQNSGKGQSEAVSEETVKKLIAQSLREFAGHLLQE
ncbi:glycine/sarcosine/betaine reductase complex component C subunit beta [Desulfosporosinus orientis]|uniref:glycine/sarcosine/betaine reductase complex component C subunit beta n=1 Tax=Desulfosporosinus orientis TaxID=1563 RepID=UPI0005A74D8E|nr:glycine/sarcosine/betaine reductase complex component C subunit beta [Desulfosporosinus orientis]